MLYFSQSKQDPERIDLDQLAKLRSFKQKTFPSALIETYSNPVEFKDKLSRQLEIQLRTLLALESDESKNAPAVPPVTDILVHFAQPDTAADTGTDIVLSTRLIRVDDFDQIPDYTETKATKEEKKAEAGESLLATNYLRLLGAEPNKNFYRQQITYQILKAFFVPVRFWLKNKGGVGARDVFIDLKIEATTSGVILLPLAEFPSSPPSATESSFTLPSMARIPAKPDTLLSRSANSWSTQLEVRALQPQREVSPATEFLIGAMTSCDVVVTARVYADTLPEPSKQDLRIHLNVQQTDVKARDIVSEIQPATGAKS